MLVTVLCGSPESESQTSRTMLLGGAAATYKVPASSQLTTSGNRVFIDLDSGYIAKSAFVFSM